MVDAWLPSFCTGVAGGYDADKGPPAFDFGHQRPSRVALAGVFATPVIAGTHHLVVDDHIDALVAMPTFTLTIGNHRNVNHLKQNKANKNKSEAQMHSGQKSQKLTHKKLHFSKKMVSQKLLFLNFGAIF